ncbi:hypothetical protein C8Q75DRAFT_800553 [Abortiporus biennis]|nr:hypothetical protein C8Q75DRAFT_800553 [Abortiporus biennis]
MSATANVISIHPNVHPESKSCKGELSSIPHPPPADQHETQHKKPIPDTGWRGSPDIPSKDGGHYEIDFMHKLPHVPHTETSVRLVKNVGDASLHFFSIETRSGDHYVPCKVSCNVCRSPMFDEGRMTVSAYPGSFKFQDHKVPLDFQPTAHIFYSQRVMDVPDGIPKWSGHKGSSELMEELANEPGTLPKYKGSTYESEEHANEK